MKTSKTKLSIGKRIRVERKKRGISQTRLAQQLAVTPSHLSRIETDVVIPSLELTEAIARALSLDDLVAQVEQARLESYRQGIISRREIKRTRQPRSQEESEIEQKAAAIVQDLLADAQLARAYSQLKTALNNPSIRQTTFEALEAFANSYDQSPHFRLAARRSDVGQLRRHFIDHPIPLFVGEVSVTIEPNDDEIILHFQNSQFDLEGSVVTVYKIGSSPEQNAVQRKIENSDVMFALSELGLTIRQLDWVRFRVELANGRAVEERLL